MAHKQKCPGSVVWHSLNELNKLQELS